ARQAEHDHEPAHIVDVPALRAFDPLAVDVVGGYGDRRNVGKEVVQQDLLGDQRKEWQQRRRQGHADHVPEVGAGRDVDVLQRIGEGAAAFLDPTTQDVEIGAKHDHVGGFARDVHGALHRDADVGNVQRGRVVDAVAEIADSVPGALQRAH